MTIVTSIEGMDTMSVLGSEMVHNLELKNYDIYEILQTLLNFQKREPIITLGYIEPEYASKTRSINVTSDSVLRVIHQLRQTVGGYIFVDINNKLHWTKEIGEDKGQQIRYRKNLVGIERDIDYSQICNRVFVYGQEKGDGEQISLKDLGFEEEYVDDDESQTQWGGIYSRVFSDKRITHPETLYDWGKRLLEYYKDPIISYTIDAVNFAGLPGMDFDALQLGSVVTVIDEDLGINVKLNVVSIIYPDIDTNPHQMEVQLATKTRDITDSLAGVYDTQQLESTMPTDVSAGQVVIKGDFTVLDWVTKGQTTISGNHITTGTITASQLIKTQELITDSAQIGFAVIDNASIKSLEANKITGNIINAQIANLDGAKIENATISDAKIQNLSANKIQGQIVDAQVANIDWAKINNVEVTNAQIKNINADKIQGQIIDTQIANIHGAKIQNATITSAKIASVSANSISGQIVDAQVANIDWAKITNVQIESADIGSINANKIIGQLVNAQIANLDGAKIINATISDAKIQNLNASKISGQIANYQILEVDWAKIKNVQISSAQIGDISANKITSGYLSANIELSAGFFRSGGVTIDTSGITINNDYGSQVLRFTNNYRTAYVAAQSDGALILSGSDIICNTTLRVGMIYSSYDLIISPYQGNVVLNLDSGRCLRPNSHGTAYLGMNNYRWKAIYGENFCLGTGTLSISGNLSYEMSGGYMYLKLYYGGSWYYFRNVT